MKSDAISSATPDTIPFHQRITALKEQKGLTAKDIAKSCGVSESTISRYFSGVSIPPEDVAQKIIHFLKSQPDKVQPETEEEDMQTVLNMLEKIYEGRIADLWKALTASRRDKCALFILVLVLLVLLFYFLFDAANAGWGFFQMR